MSYRARHRIPDLGVGVGMRRPHVAHLLREPAALVDWLEIISENFLAEGGIQRAHLEAVRQKYRLVPHGVSLSVGGTDPVDAGYLGRLRALAHRIDAPWFSDHLCWTGVAGVDVHDLLPLPYTRRTLEYAVERVKLIQGECELPFALENASTYLAFRESTVPESEFLGELAERADCGILLDVNNVFVSAYNHGLDAKAYLSAIPADRVVQIHLAGHEDKGAYLLDTHSDHVRAEVWDLYRDAIRRCGAVSTLIEWDQSIPTWEVLVAEAEKARACRNEALLSRARKDNTCATSL